MCLDKVWAKGRWAILACYGMAKELTDWQVSSGAIIGQAYSFVEVLPSECILVQKSDENDTQDA